MNDNFTRRQFLKTTARSALTISGVTDLFAQQSSTRRPNLVFVFPDQMRGQAMGFMKQDPAVTPCLDKFARECLVLTHAVSNYPVCSPYRAMLMTGKYPHANRVLSNCNSTSAPYNCELQESDRCWPDILKEGGFSA